MKAQYKESVRRDFDATDKADPWGEHEHLENTPDPIEAVLCDRCFAEFKVDARLVRYIRDHEV